MRRCGLKITKSIIIFAVCIFIVVIAFISKKLYTEKINKKQCIKIVNEYFQLGYTELAVGFIRIDDDRFEDLVIITGDSHNDLVYVYLYNSIDNNYLPVSNSGLGSDGYLEYSTDANIIISEYDGVTKDGMNYSIRDYYDVCDKTDILVNSIRINILESGEKDYFYNGNNIDLNKYYRIVSLYDKPGSYQDVSYSTLRHINNLKEFCEF